MTKRIIWTGDVYRSMAASLLLHFGPYDPANYVVKRKGFKAWAKGFAKMVGAKGEGAVEVQVNNMLPNPIRQPQSAHDNRYRFLAIAAALETGYMQTSDLNALPKLRLVA